MSEKKAQVLILDPPVDLIFQGRLVSGHYLKLLPIIINCC